MKVIAGRILPAKGPSELPTIVTQRELAALFKVSTRTVRSRGYPRLPGPGQPRYLLNEVLAFDRRRKSA